MVKWFYLFNDLLQASKGDFYLAFSVSPSEVSHLYAQNTREWGSNPSYKVQWPKLSFLGIYHDSPNSLPSPLKMGKLCLHLLIPENLLSGYAQMTNTLWGNPANWSSMTMLDYDKNCHIGS